MEQRHVPLTEACNDIAMLLPYSLDLLIAPHFASTSLVLGHKYLSYDF